jgi:hypothetical protein
MSRNGGISHIRAGLGVRKLATEAGFRPTVSEDDILVSRFLERTARPAARHPAAARRPQADILPPQPAEPGCLASRSGRKADRAGSRTGQSFQVLRFSSALRLQLPGRTKGPLGDQHANGPSQGRNALRFDSRRYCALGRSCVIAFNLAQNGTHWLFRSCLPRSSRRRRARPVSRRRSYRASAFSAPA